MSALRVCFVKNKTVRSSISLPGRHVRQQCLWHFLCKCPEKLVRMIGSLCEPLVDAHWMLLQRRVENNDKTTNKSTCRESSFSQKSHGVQSSYGVPYLRKKAHVIIKSTITFPKKHPLTQS